MYPHQIEIIKSFLPKFSCRQSHVIQFLRENRLYEGGVEDKKCRKGVHHMSIGQTAYVYAGVRHGLGDAYCSDMACFLSQLDASTVRKFLKL